MSTEEGQEAQIETQEEGANNAELHGDNELNGEHKQENGTQNSTESSEGEQSNKTRHELNESQGQEEKRKPRSQQRIEQLVQEKKDLQERLKAYEELKRPDAEKYDDDDEYEIDKTAYVQQKATEKLERKRLQALEQRAQQEAYEAYKSASMDFYGKIDKAQEETRNFIRGNQQRFKPRAQDIEMDIMDSDYAAEIFEVILQDVDRFNSMSDKQFIKSVAKIEAKFENANKAVKPPISVPNPPTSLDQSNTGAQAGKNTNPDWGRYSFAQAYKMR